MTFKLSAGQIAEIVGGVVLGSPDVIARKLNRADNAQEGDLVFIAKPGFEKFLSERNPSIVLVPKDFPKNPDNSQAFIKCENPYKSFVIFLNYIDNLSKQESGIHKSVVVGNNTQIGKNADLRAGVVIGNNCKVGDNILIYPNVTIYDYTEIGDNCIIHAGIVIGGDGFGFELMEDESYLKIPQLGNVIIGNNVEIGANTTIDRSLVGSTIISNGVKIDNLVQIAHNVEIGENTVIASQTGIAGSVKIGKRVKFGGQVGSAGHISIADDVTIMAQSGIAQDVEKAGTYFGSPIRPRLEAIRIINAVGELPNMLKKIRKLEKYFDKKE
jgi:UDP-3-O-[3-hydroxymyristoyl] glucosamine N-acyltransferase